MLPDRITDRIDASGPCWLWAGLIDAKGYGRVWADGTNRLTHRYVYEQLVEPIPEGMTLDHLCRVRHCCNPDHLEIVTQRVNVLRSPITVSGREIRLTHCVNGHALDAANTYPSSGRRRCRVCTRERQRRYDSMSQTATTTTTKAVAP